MPYAKIQIVLHLYTSFYDHVVHYILKFGFIMETLTDS